MRAARLDAIGKELELVEVPDPVPAPGETVVRLHAAGLNHRDVWIRQGLYARIQLPCILGSDGAGVVGARRVVLAPCYGWGSDPRVQSREFAILGMPRQGTFAEQIAVPSEWLFDIPAHLSFAEAAALPVAGITAYRSLVTRGGLQAGEHVLVTGIGGGVATLALQFAHALGAKVSVTSSSEEKLLRAKELGALAGVSYKKPGWDKELVAQVGRPPSLIIDGAGGDGLNNLIAAVAPAGRIVLYGATRRSPRELEMARIFFKQIDLRGATMGTPEDFRAMLQLVERARIKPVVDRVLPLAKAAEASRLLEESQQMGKVVLDCT